MVHIGVPLSLIKSLLCCGHCVLLLFGLIGVIRAFLDDMGWQAADCFLCEGFVKRRKVVHDFAKLLGIHRNARELSCYLLIIH